jgi:hypothetical protein
MKNIYCNADGYSTLSGLCVGLLSSIPRFSTGAIQLQALRAFAGYEEDILSADKSLKPLSN